MNDVALVDLTDAGQPGKRGHHVRIVEGRLGVVDRSLVGLGLRRQLIDRRLLGVDLLLLHRIGGEQPGVALEIELGVGEQRFILRLLGDRDVVLGLVGVGSILAMTDPWVTSCPSLKSIFISLPSTWLRTRTVLSALAVPTPSR